MLEESSNHDSNLKTEVLEKRTKFSASRFRTWRGLNTSILLIAFFAPWFRFHGFDFSGYEVSITNLEALMDSINPYGMAGVNAIGGGSFIVYVILNLVLVFKKEKPRNKAWLILPLMGQVPFLVLVWIIRLSPDGELLWGYLLVWVGVLSSILLELIVLLILLDKKFKQLGKMTQSSNQ